MIRAILDFPPRPGAAPERLSFTAPRRVLEAGSAAEVPGVLRAAQAEAEAGRWVVGFVGYEAAPAFDAALRTREPAGPAPVAWFAAFDAADAVPDPEGGEVARLHWLTRTTRSDYDCAIREIQRRIAAGDVYQVNHTLRFRAACDIEPLPLYDALVAGRHGLHCALIETPSWSVVSASPELFFDIDADRVITTRPMKGTCRRGRWSGEDADAARRLATSPKDRAENLMIVDLLRNDLGRIAEFGSVAVPRIYTVETYPTVHQLTSTVTARLREGTGLCDVFTAMFPCGSITGAPKVTAMRTIAELEDEPRGAYCGAAGVLRPDGSATFNVAIRTLVIDRADRSASYGAGGGITWDSRAAAEYDEVVAKGALLTEMVPRFALVETLRLDDGCYSRLDRHLHRLADSARYWRFSDDAHARAARALETLRRELDTGSWRVRLTLARDGAVHTQYSALAEPYRGVHGFDAGDGYGRHGGGSGPDGPANLPCAVIARTAVSSSDRLLFHKTTARAVYDDRHADAPEAFDVLLFNEHGMVTEFTIGNVVVEIDGRLVTPPREHGLLAGTLRAELLDRGVIAEAPIPLDQIRDAERVFHINSVRGVTRVVLGGSGKPG
jgi:para-aminobenzoate synthetase / 4-amino-4-deoxychorismate lyase